MKQSESDAPSTGCPDGMRPIPGGTLYLGSPDNKGDKDEHPQQKVSVAEFCMDAHEVTVAEYRSCEKNKACVALPTSVRLLTATPLAEQTKLSALCSAKIADNDELPATCVSFEEASKFCAWKGHRLPSEAEWEWVATGGDDKLDWPWGAAMPSDENVCWQSQRGPCGAKGKAAGAFEIYGMAGNVAEWTSTAYAPYGGTAPKADVNVVRGGSWESTKPEQIRPKRRDSRVKAVRENTLGFRCAASK